MRKSITPKARSTVASGSSTVNLTSVRFVIEMSARQPSSSTSNERTPNMIELSPCAYRSFQSSVSDCGRAADAGACAVGVSSAHAVADTVTATATTSAAMARRID